MKEEAYKILDFLAMSIGMQYYTSGDKWKTLDLGMLVEIFKVADKAINKNFTSVEEFFSTIKSTCIGLSKENENNVFFAIERLQSFGKVMLEEDLYGVPDRDFCASRFNNYLYSLVSLFGDFEKTSIAISKISKDKFEGYALKNDLIS